MAYTNSPLVSYTKISPNRNSPRNHVIDTISIHCVVGQLTVEALGNVFATTARQASSNYGIGKDGRIALYVEEKDRSWCTSSASNDNRAITIEVASDTTHPYAVNDKAYAALIDLLEDICRRNNIKRLLWKADKSLIGQVDKQNMTVHRWFASKSCPGDYLYNRHGQIADEVNKRLGTLANNAQTFTAKVEVSPAVRPVEKPKKSNEEIIWDFLYGKIGNSCGVAGIMGNLYAESGLNPKNLMNSYEKKLGFTDETYTKAIDDGEYTGFSSDGAAYGLAQWMGGRKNTLIAFAKSKNKSVGDLEVQLEYLYKELSESHKDALESIKKATNVLSASTTFLTKFERPADTGVSVRAKRAELGRVYYNKYKKEEPKSSKVETHINPVVSVNLLGKTDNKKETKHSHSFNEGDTVKLLSTATYSDGSSIPKWIFGKILYVRRVNGDEIVVSTLKTGAITGRVHYKHLLRSTETSKIEESEKELFKVMVNTEVLNVRKGPGMSYDIIDTVSYKEIYSVYEQSAGVGASSWCRIGKDRWISLDYCKKL